MFHIKSYVVSVCAIDYTSVATISGFYLCGTDAVRFLSSSLCSVLRLLISCVLALCSTGNAMLNFYVYMLSCIHMHAVRCTNAVYCTLTAY
jgi:hypothetical protein